MHYQLSMPGVEIKPSNKVMTTYDTPALRSQNFWFLQFLEETEMIQIIQCSDFLSYLQ